MKEEGTSQKNTEDSLFSYLFGGFKQEIVFALWDFCVEVAEAVACSFFCQKRPLGVSGTRTFCYINLDK